MESEDGVPCGLENFPARLLHQYYPLYEPARCYDLLPMYSNDWYNYKIQRQYSLIDNDCLREKWNKFICDPSMEKGLVFPTARGNRFIKQMARYQPPNEAPGYCRAPMSLLPGPLVDEYGPLPIPADYLNRYRDKFQPKPKKKIEKEKINDRPQPPPTPAPPTPPLLCACPPPPVCNCPPLPFYCCCPPPEQLKQLPPTPPQPRPPLPPTPPQVQNTVCTASNTVSCGPTPPGTACTN